VREEGRRKREGSENEGERESEEGVRSGRRGDKVIENGKET
jgi:hypothetical protein